MPALSLSQITTLLEHYAPTDGSFLPRINQTLQRIHNMGTYRDLTVQYSLSVVDGLVTLPDDADAVLHALVDGQPSAVRSLWHDFKSHGLGTNDISWGLVDSGYCPVFRALPEPAVGVLYVVPSPESPSQLPFDTVNGGIIEVIAVGETRILRDSTSDAGFDGEEMVFEEDLTRINQIRYEGLIDRYDVRTTLLDPLTTIATVGPGSGVTRYRRFRVPGSTDGSTTIHLLCKRAFTPLVNNEDITYVGNINAIKNGLLATVAEDANDVERGQFFWGQSLLLMEEEAASSRGAAQPRLTLDPWGAEGKMGVVGMM